jgi:PEP-CTERM/exosortase A-associated glycosyltransferase
VSRVLHVLDHSWPVLDGYSMRSRSIVRAQQAIGLQPAIVTSPLHDLDDAASAETTVDGVRHFRAHAIGLAGRSVARRWPLVRELQIVRVLAARIRSLLRAEHVDVLHAHSPSLCGLAALQVSRATGIPAVYELRAYWEDGAVERGAMSKRSPRYWLSRRLETFVARRAHAAVGISEAIVDDLRMRGVSPDRLFCVPNGVDATEFHPRSRDAELAASLGLSGGLVLGFIGTFFPWEGLPWLVGAVGELRRRGVPATLLIVGSGEAQTAIETAVRQADASRHVILTGRVPHDQVSRYYSVIDVMVYPRRPTRLTDLVTPLKPLEAMAQGKAILASDLRALRELIRPDVTGVLFDPEDVDDFCRKAQRLLTDESWRRAVSDRAREDVLATRDWKRLAQRYEAVYATATRNAGH